MKDFAVRIWDSKNKEMVVVTDLTLNTFYKLHTGENTEEPMLASPYYDANGVRLFENDVVIPLIKPKGSENRCWGDITAWPTKQEDFADIGDYDMEYYVVSLEDSWRLNTKIGVNYNSSYSMYEELIRKDNWRGLKRAHPDSIKYVKIGTIYLCSKRIEEAKKAYEMKKETEKKEKELQCLMKLKAKYENTELCESES